MSSHAEETLFLYLDDVNALDYLDSYGLDEAAIPTESMRPVVAWCMAQYHRSGRITAPSVGAITQEWADTIADAQVVLSDGTEIADTIEWVCETLHQQYVRVVYQQWIKDSALDMMESVGPESISVLSRQADLLGRLAARFEPKHTIVSAESGLVEAARQYEVRAVTERSFHGLSFGFPEIDAYTFGIHPGEICTVAGYAGAGKSFVALNAAKSEWLRGSPCALFTLENSIEETMDRFVCMMTHVNYRRFQRGTLDQTESERVREFISDRVPKMTEEGLYIISPEDGKRTPEAMTRQARSLGAKSIIIDQLNFIESDDNVKRKERRDQVWDILRRLKVCISGNEPLSCMMLHQINREGIKSAEKIGRLEMYHMAEGAEVERVSALVCAIYQSQEARQAQEMLWQMLKFRRDDTTNWLMSWRPGLGDFRVINEVKE